MNPYDNQLQRVHSKEDIKKKSLEDKYRKLIEIIGKSGRYQYILMSICVVVSFVGYYISTLIPLLKEMPDYKCINSNEFKQNKEFELYKNNKHIQIVENAECIHRYCKIYDKSSSYLIVVNLKSIVNFITDFKMFCNVDEFFGNITQSLFIGRVVGTIILSYIGDKYGRKISFYIQFYVSLGSLIIMSITNNPLMLYIAIFSNGFSSQIFVLTIVICSEVMDQNMFGMYNGVVSGFFSLCGFVNVCLMYFTRNWNISLYLYILIMFIIVVFSYRFIFESTSFLLKYQRFDEIDRNYEFIAKINDNEKAYKEEKLKYEKFTKPSVTAKRRKLVDFEYKDKKEENDSKLSLKEVFLESSIDPNNSVIEQILGPYYTIFSSKDNTLNMIKCGFLFFSVYLLFYGLLFNLDKIEGDLYLHNLIMYASEMIAELNIGYILSRYKRIPTFISINSLCFICF